MAWTRFANSIFCDDIRSEVGNKTSLMGIYQGDIVFPLPPPLVVPKFVVAFWLITDLDDPIDKLSVRLLAPDNVEALRAELDNIPNLTQNSEGAIKRSLFGALQISNLTLEKEGFLEVWIDTEQEPQRAGRLRVRFLGPTAQNPTETLAQADA